MLRTGFFKATLKNIYLRFNRLVFNWNWTSLHCADWRSHFRAEASPPCFKLEDHTPVAKDGVCDLQVRLFIVHPKMSKRCAYCWTKMTWSSPVSTFFPSTKWSPNCQKHLRWRTWGTFTTSSGSKWSTPLMAYCCLSDTMFWICCTSSRWRIVDPSLHASTGTWS